MGLEVVNRSRCISGEITLRSAGAVVAWGQVWSFCGVEVISHEVAVSLALETLEWSFPVSALAPSMEGERPWWLSLGLSLFLPFEQSLGGVCVVSHSAPCKLCGPGVGGRCLGSLFCQRSGPNFPRIRFAIRAASESDPSSSVNLSCVEPLQGHRLPISSPSTASKDCAILIRSSIRRTLVVTACTRSSWLSKAFRNWSVIISSLAIGSSSGHVTSANFCNAPT